MFRVREQVGWHQSMLQAGGSGVTVAVLDTGVAAHPDLSGRILDFKDFTEGREAAYDDSGHGTHVCGIACGSGTLSKGKYCGMAPKADLVVGKVLDGRGDGTVNAMLAGIRWVLQERDRLGIRILNVSVGVSGQMDADREKVLKEMLESAWQKGLAVVCAAGNNGPAENSLSEIGKSHYLITVGCHDGAYYKGKANRCAAYSARGSLFDTVRKPDIVAPGTEIISCNGGVRRTRGGYQNAYIAKSGTSMATPVVSGALALLFQQHPEYDNETAKRKLLYAADDLKEPWVSQGWGMINVERLLE